MDSLPSDVFVNLFVTSTWLASLGAWVFLIARLRSGRPLIAYEPREPVPWNVAAAAVPLVYVGMLLGASLAGMEAPSAEKITAWDVIANLLITIVSQPLMAGAVLFIVAAMSGANARDLGLPKSAQELSADIWLGFVTFLAAIAPAQLIQLALIVILGLKDAPGHPLFHMVAEGGSSIVILLLATVVVVIVAPLAEEILFRLLLQGWLEKWEDKRLGWRRESSVEVDEIQRPGSVDALYSDSKLNDVVLVPVSSEDSMSPGPPQKGLFGLPYGWVPILGSSLVFAVAHAGYGPEPVAIFVLALILGYVYQRTHRTVPTMVAHALFNAFAMVILWRIALGKGQ